MVGVTGSIPVAPTIPVNELRELPDPVTSDTFPKLFHSAESWPASTVVLNFDSETKGGRELQSQVWPGGTAIVRVSCDRQVGEGRFEAGCVATLEQREMRADGFRGEWQRVAAGSSP